ncbi:hypothetical protein DJFAAGMI_03235 [Comamonas sp. PE63]|uniref:Uncharacterized protein n=1 Tax=Comamonas brasiliensis TaxID=1812482 RepID=A0ABS5LVF1_9BURK|nr:hypothetical protein [Comamonas sp. PE63]
MAVIVNLTLGVITPPVGGLLFAADMPTRASITALACECHGFCMPRPCLPTVTPALTSRPPHTQGFQQQPCSLFIARCN